tara:strand:+ start:413 stop:946 length:534 start_codon:yes stop_codon:yes gene_type:complete
MPPINSTKIDDNDEHSSSGFPYDLLALIIPFGIIFLIIMYICIIENISKCKESIFNRRYSDTDSVSSFGSDIHFPAVYKEPEIPKHKTNRFFVKEMDYIIIKDSTKFQDICSICIGPFENEDRVVKFNCQHIFHRECIQPWLVRQLDNNTKPFCPMCKNELEIEYRDEKKTEETVIN